MECKRKRTLETPASPVGNGRKYMDDKTILKFSHVTGKGKKFGLKDVSFSLPAGYLMGLAGKNGAGKTTLIDYIMNPNIRYSGTISIDGMDIRKDFTAAKDKIGFVSEENRFFETYSAAVNAKLLGRFYKQWDAKLFDTVLRETGVSGARTVGQMSRGERFKFQMAFAMAHRPVLYLLDEATAGMDPVFRIDFFKMLHKVIESGEASVLLTSHIQEELVQKTDYTGILEKGIMTKFGESVEVWKEKTNTNG